MNKLRIASASGILGLAGLVSLPVSTAHAADAAAPTGEAHASALNLTVNPQALLNVSPQLASVLQSLPAVSSLVSSGSTLGLTIDGANATGTLTNDLTNVTAAHADSTPVHLDLSALQNLIGALNSTIKGLTTVDAQATLASVLSTVNPAIGAQITKLNSDIPGALNGLVQALGGNAQLNTTLKADLGGVEHQDSTLLQLPTLPAPVGTISLAPFHANAVNVADAAKYSVPAGASADNSTTALNVLPAIGAMSSVNIPNLVTELTNLKATLSTVLTTVQSAAGAPLSTVQGLVANTPLAGITNQALNLVQTTTNAAGQQVVNAAPLATLQSQLDTLITNLNILNTFNSGFDGINGIVKTSQVTSTSSLIPDAGGITAVATTKLAYVDVLPLPVALGPVAAGTSLIHLEAVNAASTSSLGTGKQNGASGGLGTLTVLGQPISLDGLVQGTTKTVDLSALGLTVNITRGVPVNSVTADTASSKMSVLEVQVLTSPASASALAPLTSAFGARTAGAAAPATQLVDLQVGTATTLVSRNTPQQNAPAVPQTAGPSNPSTGMFGPLAAIGGAGLAGVAVLMQLVPRVIGRRRRDA